MTVSKFRIQVDNTYTRCVDIRGISYTFVVSSDVWNANKVTSHVNYWIKRKKQGKSPVFKYGSVKEMREETVLKCEKCDKQYKTRYGLLRHINNHHSESEETTIETHTVSEVSTQNIINNITNQTNNIQNNITVRSFGKENPKWITEKVIVDALRNIPSAIMNLVKEKHFNDNFPENRNVELCSEFRNRYLTIQEDSRKKVVDRKAMFMKMCDNACDAVTTTLESYSEPLDSDESEDEDESPEDRRCRLVASRIRRSSHFSAVVDQYIDKWQGYVSEVEHDEVLKKADHYITMLLLDLKLALAHEEEMLNTREVAE
jgi:uncharacterized C2H2 Zn-finger protein